MSLCYEPPSGRGVRTSEHGVVDARAVTATRRLEDEPKENDDARR